MSSNQNKFLENFQNNGKIEEEFNNFMHRVNEINSIVRKLASTDKTIQKIGDEEAKRYLHDGKQSLENVQCENDMSLKVTTNRTVINRKALQSSINESQDQMSKEAFMEEMSKDAEKRYKDKLIRKEKMETFKKQASLAYKREEYEKALVLYNKAIDQIKDNQMLYINRALTCIKLNLLDRAKTDLKEWALKLNENSCKAWLLLAKVYWLNDEVEECDHCILEAKQRNDDKIKIIEEYIAELKNNTNTIMEQ